MYLGGYPDNKADLSATRGEWRDKMKAETYYKKHGKIYGVSSRYEFGWKHTVYVFDSLEEAEKWLRTETCCFAERELCSRTRAEQITGRKVA